MANVEELADRIKTLEARLHVPAKAALAAVGTRTADARVEALGLKPAPRVTELANAIRSIADRNDYLVEFTVQDITHAGGVACCCCCCCCC